MFKFQSELQCKTSCEFWANCERTLEENLVKLCMFGANGLLNEVECVLVHSEVLCTAIQIIHTRTYKVPTHSIRNETLTC